MAKRTDQRRIYPGRPPRGPRTVTEHNRANTLELAMQAVMAGTMSYTEYTLLQLDLYPARAWDEPS